MNDNYNQLFIDNLKGKDGFDIFQIIENNNIEKVIQEFMINSNFIENNISFVLNCIKFNIWPETKSFNSINYLVNITEKLIKNKSIYELIKKNIILQGTKNIRMNVLIKDIFSMNYINLNNNDFYEIINSRLEAEFTRYLLNIIYHAFK